MTKEGTDSNEFHEKEDTRMQLLECGRYKKTTFARDIIGGKYHDDKFAEIFYLESVTYNSNDSGTKWQDIVLRDVTGWIRGRVWAENIIPEYERYTGTVVLVQGRYTVYAGKPDLTIDRMEEAEYYEVSDYIETISGDSKNGHLNGSVKSCRILRSHTETWQTNSCRPGGWRRSPCCL